MRILRTGAVLAAAIAVGAGLGWGIYTFDAGRDGKPSVMPAPLAGTSSVPEPCLASAAVTAEAPAISTQPVLRVELGEHIGAIRALAVSKSGKTLVTGGWDKTVRLWTLADVDGARLRQPKLRDTLSVPIGTDRTGEAYAVALSPDEAFVAVGGRMSDGLAPDRERIYIFDVASARIVAVLPVAQLVSSLAYSQDGLLLAAGAAEGVGLCVWSTADWRLVGHDSNYGGRIGGVAFAADRLATASDDGAVRTYGKDFSKPAARHEFATTDAGHRPTGVAFSPNGKVLAVGYFDAPFLSLHDAGNIGRSVKLQPAAGSDPELLFPFVAWSGDGRAVFAGGSSIDTPGSPRAQTVFQKWTADQSKPVQDLQSAAATLVKVEDGIDQIQGLAADGNGVAFVTRNGDIVGVGEDNRTSYSRSPSRIDWRVLDWTQGAKDFLVSPDGSRVTVKLFDGRHLRFDLAQRNKSAMPFLGSASGDQAGLTPPLLKLDGRTVSLKNPDAPTLEGGAGEAVDLWLGGGERAASFAASEAAQAFAVGTNHNILLFSATGDPRGGLPVPETAQRIAITKDGRYVVATIRDGTIRWYKIVKSDNRTMWDLEEVLAVYFDRDGKRWIAWTKAGYYDAAAGAEELINWQVNRGPAQSGLNFSVGRFKETYRQSNVIDKALLVVKAGPDAAQSLAKSPPVLRITGWQQLENLKLRVAYDLDWLPQSQQKIESVIGLVDGTSQPAGRGFQAVENKQVVVLDLPPGEGRRQVQLRARTIDSLLSDPASLELPPLKAPAAVERNLYAVVVGVSKYRSLPAASQLKYADADAREIATLLNQQAGPGRLYSKVYINPVTGKALTDGEATRDNILAELRGIKTGPNDVALLFLAGHGTVERTGLDEGDTSVFLPHDARMEGPQVLPASTISVREIAALFFNANNRARKLVFVDACRSGNFAPNNGSLLADVLKDNRSDVAVWSAATVEQFAYESDKYDGGHGAFTAAMIEAFRGKDAFARLLQKPDRFTESELNLWLERRVPELAGIDASGEERQTPVKLLAGVKKEIALVVR